MTTDIPRDEAEAALEARRDLGADYEPALVESFVDRLDGVIERRVAEAVERQAGLAKQARKQQSERSGQSLALGIVSMALAIPLLAITSEAAGATGMILVLVTIAVINVAFALSNRRI